MRCSRSPRCELLPRTARWALLRLSGMRVKTRSIREACYFGSNDVTIGRGTRVNRGCFFDALSADPHWRAVLHWDGSDVRHLDARDCDMMTAAPARGTPQPIEIGDGCWIGARATILPGVTIGDGVVIAAGAVVVSDCEDDTLYAGVPARAVRKL